MSWKLRHEGSPRFIDGLTLAQVVEGLQDSLWEPTDEVMGPKDTQWVCIESHPQLAETAADIEPPPPKVEEDETRLDMNPLIDVALVLLIFFIMTTSYAALQKILKIEGLGVDPGSNVAVATREELQRYTIRVKARQENGRPVIWVEDKPVAEEHLAAALDRYVNDKTRRKTEVLIDAAGVPWSTVVAIQDAARGAGVQKANWLVDLKEARKRSAPE